MKRYLIRLSLFPLFFFSGCVPLIHTYNAVDSKISRPVKPDFGSYQITLQIEGEKKESKIIRLEQYYDSQSSTRGNYWDWRIQGEKYASNLFISGYDKRFGKIKFRFLSTERLGRCSVNNIRSDVIFIDDFTYSHHQSSNLPNTLVRYEKGRVIESINLQYRIDITYIPD